MPDLTLHAVIPSEKEMRALAEKWVKHWDGGVTVLLHGDLGSGKTTFVRGALEGLGVTDPVRSPTFNLIQTFVTDPPVMHADLYRVQSAKGIGVEEYLGSYLCFVEWPDRLGAMVDPSTCWNVTIEFADDGRIVTIEPPEGTSIASFGFE